MNYLTARTANYTEDQFSKFLSKDDSGFYARTVSAGGSSVKPKARTVIGLCSVFGNVDAVRDIVAPGAFKRSIAEFEAGCSRARFLWNHNSSEPPVAKILELKELTRDQLPPAYRSAGVLGALMVKRRYFTDGYSERIFQGVCSGAIAEMSFAYNTVRSHAEDGKNGRVNVLDELELMDASDVNYGCNPLTSATIGHPEIVKGSDLAGLRMLKDMRREMHRFEASLDVRDRSVGDWDRMIRSLGSPSGNPSGEAFMENARWQLDQLLST